MHRDGLVYPVVMLALLVITVLTAKVDVCAQTVPPVTMLAAHVFAHRDGVEWFVIGLVRMDSMVKTVDQCVSVTEADTAIQ